MAAARRGPGERVDGRRLEDEVARADHVPLPLALRRGPRRRRRHRRLVGPLARPRGGEEVGRRRGSGRPDGRAAARGAPLEASHPPRGAPQHRRALGSRAQPPAARPKVVAATHLPVYRRLLGRERGRDLVQRAARRHGPARVQQIRLAPHVGRRKREARQSTRGLSTSVAVASRWGVWCRSSFLRADGCESVHRSRASSVPGGLAQWDPLLLAAHAPARC
mmetsp:Transcript_118518/g.377768  ORF Transcript_118518/g.377768 Transcript_118518/m.377768 type:complete len:221 (+) Transcript_118518:214-876(+)